MNASNGARCENDHGTYHGWNLHARRNCARIERTVGLTASRRSGLIMKKASVEAFCMRMAEMAKMSNWNVS